MNRDAGTFEREIALLTPIFLCYCPVAGTHLLFHVYGKLMA